MMSFHPLVIFVCPMSRFAKYRIVVYTAVASGAKIMDRYLQLLFLLQRLRRNKCLLMAICIPSTKTAATTP